MEQEKLEKFIQNMRATGHADDIIAEQLIATGNSDLVVLNLFGVSHLDELTEKPEDIEDFSPATDAIPSAVPLGMETPTTEPIAEPAAPKVAQPRAYPRPAPRNTPEAKPLETPTAENLKYGHQTYDDFMDRIEAHKEIEADTHHTLATGSTEVDKTLETKQHEADVQRLLHDQEEVAAEGPSGPEMDDLITPDVTKELESIEMPTEATGKGVEPATPAPTMSDVSHVSKVSYWLHNIRGNNWILFFVMVTFFGILIGLAYTITLQIL